MSAKPICNSHHDREKWLEARKQYVTASETVVVMGLSPWQSPLQLYMQKLGMLPPVEESESMYWGSTLEPVIVAELGKRTDRQVTHAADLDADMYASEVFPWLACTIDGRWCYDDDPMHRLIEAKTAGAYAASKWNDDVPEMYQWQMQHQMLVMGACVNTVCALLAGQKFVWCDVERDEDMIERIIEATRDFNRRLDLGRRALNGEDVEVDPPSPSAGDADALAALYPEVEPDSTVILGQDEIAIDDAITERNDEIKRLTELNDADKNLIRLAIGSAEKGILPGGVGAWTLKASKTGRVLRRVKG